MSYLGDYVPALETDWQMVCSPGLWVILIETQLEVMKPFQLLLSVVLSTLLADNVFDQDAAVLVELVSPVPIRPCSFEIDKV
jgi:hypothetical protein